MLSSTSRRLTNALAALYAVLGLLLFFGSAAVAEHFAWKVSPFVTMTVGAWCLGNSWVAWIAARRWRWSRTYSLHVYLWCFGLLELLVVVAFRDKLKVAEPLTWLYLAALVGTVVAAVVGVADWRRLRPSLADDGRPIGPVLHGLTVAFIGIVGFIAAYALAAQPGWPGTNGGIFPEVLSPFTLRAFGAFYLAVVLGVVSLLAARTTEVVLSHAYGSYGALLIITVAALWYIRLFDFVNRPGGLIYVGIYVLVGAVLAGMMRRYGTGAA